MPRVPTLTKAYLGSPILTYEVIFATDLVPHCDTREQILKGCECEFVSGEWGCGRLVTDSCDTLRSGGDTGCHIRRTTSRGQAHPLGDRSMGWSLVKWHFRTIEKFIVGSWPEVYVGLDPTPHNFNWSYPHLTTTTTTLLSPPIGDLKVFYTPPSSSPHMRDSKVFWSLVILYYFSPKHYTRVICVLSQRFLCILTHTDNIREFFWELSFDYVLWEWS